MKKLCFIISLVILIISMSITVSYAYTPIVAGGNCGDQGDNVRWELDANGVLTISGKGAMMDWSHFNKNPDWYSYDQNIKKVHINEGVTSIGSYAFYAYKELRDVEISDTVETIGSSAFSSCSRLYGVELGKEVKRIEYHAFSGCPFNGLYIPDSVEFIGQGAFSSCSNLTSIEIPSSIDNIEQGTFWGCKKLEQVTINYGVKKIGDSAFYNCERLSKIEIPDSVQAIGAEAFYGCNWLYNIKIPNRITQIEDYTFYGCYSLINIELPDSVTSIGNYAFWGCSQLDDIHISSNIKDIGIEAFYGCNWLKNIELPNEISIIASRTFYNCSSLEAIYIPRTIAQVDSYAFDKCDNLKYVFFNGNNEEWNNMIINTGNEALTNAAVFYTKINDNTSWGGKGNVLYIVGEGSTGDFSTNKPWDEYMNNVTTIEINRGITEIGARAFEECSNIEMVTIPNSVVSIGENSFYGCSSITKIYYMGSREEWDKISIADNNETISNAEIHFSVLSYNDLSAESKRVDNDIVVNVNNKTYDEWTPTVICAVYDEYGIFQSLRCIEKAIAANDISSLTFKDIIETNYTYKVFLWDNLVGLKPLCDP